eukprot:6185762-Pleurochrysis_carterae.AAC.1
MARSQRAATDWLRLENAISLHFAAMRREDGQCCDHSAVERVAFVQRLSPSLSASTACTRLEKNPMHQIFALMPYQEICNTSAYATRIVALLGHLT